MKSLRRIDPFRILFVVALVIFLYVRRIPDAHGMGGNERRTDRAQGGSPSQEWNIGKNALHGEVEGYASATSVTPGQVLDFSVSSATPTVDLHVYRMGWYGGSGGAQVYVQQGLPARREQIPGADPDSGLVEPAWPRTLGLRIPRTWESGVYLAKLTNTDGYERFMPFVVKDAKPKPILLVHSVLTDQAYNQWGGNSLYRGKTPKLGLSRGVKVSLQRPFDKDNGAGFFFRWEYPMVRFLERQGYAVSYATDADVHNDPTLLFRHRVVLLVGHDEYWTKEMRDGYEQAVARGVNIAVFGGNTGYRQVRLESSTKTRTKRSVLVHYREAFLHDPLLKKDPARVTVEWRHPLVSRPESQLLGAMYGEQLLSGKTFSFVITNPEHWIFAGTHVRSGDTIPKILAYEIDTLHPESQPPHLEVLGQSPVIDTKGNAKMATATLTSHPGGGTVFNAGTTNWTTGLDELLNPDIADARLQLVTRNILDRFSRPPRAEIPLWRRILTQQSFLRFLK